MNLEIFVRIAETSCRTDKDVFVFIFFKYPYARRRKIVLIGKVYPLIFVDHDYTVVVGPDPYPVGRVFKYGAAARKTVGGIERSKYGTVIFDDAAVSAYPYISVFGDHDIICIRRRQTVLGIIDRSGIAHVFELPGNGISAADGRFINLGYDVFFTCTRI